MPEYHHDPVMLAEAVEGLQIVPDGIYVDGTLGGGGYTKAIAEKLTTGRVIATDLDPVAITAAEKFTKNVSDRVILVNDSYANIKKIINEHGYHQINGLVLDLGLSSNQLETADRGFSFKMGGPLDMRFGASGVPASEIINTYSVGELADLFKNYGEEPLATLIARMIGKRRAIAPIENSDELATLIEEIYSRRFRKASKVHPATRVFQALRIAVNGELDNIKSVLKEANKLLIPGGRIVVVSYHSLEDRIVKEYFRTESRDCICAPDVPICQCGHTASLKIITKKPVPPTEHEIARNPRARSAKLRIAEKI